MELRIVVDERTLRCMGRAKRAAQEAREHAAKKQREAQLEADKALVARNLALRLLKTERETAGLAEQTPRTTESEAEAQAAIEQARAWVAAEREAKARREARLNTELAQAIKKRLAADRARSAGHKGPALSGNSALRALANGVARASASPKEKQRGVAATPETIQQPRNSARAALTFIDAMDAFRPERLSRRGRADATEGEDSFLGELKRRREEKKRRAEEGLGPAARTRARRATSAGAATASASVDTLLGQLWTERASPTAQATF